MNLLSETGPRSLLSPWFHPSSGSVLEPAESGRTLRGSGTGSPFSASSCGCCSWLGFCAVVEMMPRGTSFHLVGCWCCVGDFVWSFSPGLVPLSPTPSGTLGHLAPPLLVVPPPTLELCASFAGITNLCTAVSCSNIFSLILLL